MKGTVIEYRIERNESKFRGRRFFETEEDILAWHVRMNDGFGAEFAVERSFRTVNERLIEDVKGEISDQVEFPCKYCGIFIPLHFYDKICNGCWEVTDHLDRFLKSEKGRKHVIERLSEVNGITAISGMFHGQITPYEAFIGETDLEDFLDRDAVFIVGPSVSGNEPADRLKPTGPEGEFRDENRRRTLRAALVVAVINDKMKENETPEWAAYTEPVDPNGDIMFRISSVASGGMKVREETAKDLWDDVPKTHRYRG